MLSFCEKHDLSVPNLNAQYFQDRRQHQQNKINMEHHYYFDIFNEVIDFQLQELNNRFSAQAMDLLTLSSVLDPKKEYKSFNIDDICTLVVKYYLFGFIEQERLNLKFHLRHFEYDMHNDVKLQILSFLSQLCVVLTRENKKYIISLID